MAVRAESDIFIRPGGEAVIIGPAQQDLVLI